MKRVKTSKKRKNRNLLAKQAVKNAFKAADRAIAAKSSEIEGSVKKACSIIEKAVARGIIHKNKAARKKSRLLLRYNKAK
jgi:small subunit ribosomal protein S20